jgi:hypothetical protein
MKTYIVTISVVALAFSAAAAAQAAEINVAPGVAVSGAGVADANIPLAVRAFRADLVVLGEVEKDGVTEELKLTVPGADSAGTDTFTSYSVKVRECLRERIIVTGPGSTTKPAPSRVDVLVRQPAPDAPDKTLVPVLEKGKKYLLLLSRIDGRKEYYLAPGAANCVPATPEAVDQYTEAANLEKWPWGKAVDGLELAVLVAPKIVMFTPTTTVGTGAVNVTIVLHEVRSGKTVNVGELIVPGVPVAVAIRNSNKEPVSFRLDPTAKMLGIGALRGDKTVAADLYQDVKDEAEKIVTVEGRQTVLLGPAGVVACALPTKMELAAGKWLFKATLETKSAKTGSTTQKALWAGKLESDEAIVEVGNGK